MELFANLKKNGLLVIIPFLVAMCFFSCTEEPQENKEQRKSYYDVKGFVEGQIFLLNGLKPKVSKTMTIGGQTTQVATQDIDWKKELELFAQADINKPAYRQSYEVSRPDSLSWIYVLKGNESLPVQRLAITLDTPDGLPATVEAFLKSENKLYRSEKHIQLKCIIKDNRPRISSYHITGFQKLVTMDKKPFTVTSEVQY
jgi:hypothetical protein